jgi:transposase-like protein
MASGYTMSMKNQAFRAFKEAGSCEKAMELLPFDVSQATMYRWRRKYRWDAKVKSDEIMLAEEEPSDATLKQYAEDFGLTQSDTDVYKQIKSIESICLAAIYDKKDRLDKLGLVPTTFNQAFSAMKACWDARDKILSRTQRHKSEEKKGKVNWIEMIVQAEQKASDDSTETKRQYLVCGQAENPE